MTDFKLSRRQLLGLAADFVATGMSEVEKNAAVASAPTTSKLASGKATAFDLRCEYLVNPLGVDELSPRLSWKINSNGRGWKQSAYQIVAASSLDLLKAGEGDLWDTGKVISNSSNHIEYKGSALASRQKCYWRVRSFDSNGIASPWSSNAHWEMGLLGDADWNPSSWIGRTPKLTAPVPNLDGVSWIWFAEPGVNPDVEAPAGFRWFRKSFAVPAGQKCVSAQLLFTVDDAYDVRFNGAEIAKSAVSNWQSIKLYDVTNKVVNGENAVAIIGQNISGPAGMACRLIMKFDQGEPIVLDSGADWKSFNQDTPGWDSPSFEDTAWSGAEVVAPMGGAPWNKLSMPPEALADADPAPYLRRDFTSNGSVKRARVYACGLGYADIYINGSRLGGASERDTPYTAYDKHVLYTTYDVTSLVASGANAIAAALGKGWYDVHDLAVWGFEHASWHAPQRLRLLLVVDYADGSNMSVVTDGSWKLSTGPIIRDGIYSGEIYDARLEAPGWNKTGFDASAWDQAAIVDPPAGPLKSRPCPPIAATKDIEPVDITEPTSGIYVVNFGQNFSGHVQLRIKAPAGTRITMRYGERVHADGSLDTSNIQTLMDNTDPPQLFQTDTYICNGGGAEVWEQRFGYSGFQYAEVTGFPGKPNKDNFVGRFAHTDLESAGSFLCSDDMVNKLQSATRWSYLSNSQSIPTDCPTREKNGWTGDAHLAAEMGLMNFRSEPLYTKWLNDFADNQLSDGRVGIIVPSGGWGLGDCHPAWDSSYAIVSWDMYRYSGDVRIIERHYDRIAHYVDYVTGRLQDDVIPFDSLGDWVPWKTQTPSQLSSTVFLYNDARILADAAAVLGRDSDAQKYTELADRVKAGFNAKWYNANTKMYSTGEQTAQAMPLFFGLTTDENRDDVFAALAADVERQGHIDTGILGAKYALRVLSDGGRADLVYKLITRRQEPSWAWWITQGATTLWETWGGALDSHNHIMFGDISNWFIQSLAGIGLDPGSIGFSNVIVRPQVVGGITWAKGSHIGPYGEITSSWSSMNGVFQLELTIPANATATVWIPTNDAAKVKEGSNAAAEASEVAFLRQEEGSAVYSVGSGSYVFTA